MKLLHTAVITAFLILTASSAVAGDAGAGESAFKSKGCVGCHGAGGATPMAGTTPPTPKLSGKGGAFIKQQLVDFKTGKRKSATMNDMAAMLSDSDIDNVAAYLDTQK